MTYEGSPSARFQRAISREDAMGAETAAFELGSLNLGDALALVVLYARADDRKFDRADVRWLHRLLDEQPLIVSEARRLARVTLTVQTSGKAADVAMRQSDLQLHVLRTSA